MHGWVVYCLQNKTMGSCPKHGQDAMWTFNKMHIGFVSASRIEDWWAKKKMENEEVWLNKTKIYTSFLNCCFLC
jgi:hypothetical protein